MSERLGLKCAALAALLLAACSGQPTRIYDTPSVDAGGAPKATQRRGGGYYKDDGPGDDIPDNLDAIPDAQPVFEPLHRFANRPYVVLGKSYVPATQLKSYRMRGIASWYGKKFHGQKTSIGETYDMFSMTAAHPTLPLPSYVRVTNVGNGRSVVVRVNDRGPFHANRIIDLSYAAAYRLGYINNGSTLVDVEAILPGESGAPVYAQSPPPPIRSEAVAASGPDEIEQLAMSVAASDASLPTPAAAGQAIPADGVFLQLGAFSNADNAENLRSHLARELDWLEEGIQINSGGGMYRVHLGPYANRTDAGKVAEKIRAALGYKPAFVTR
jgi:rare lipoprotein A